MQMQFLIDVGLSVLYFCIFLLLCAWSWRFWMMYIQQKAMSKINWVMLEIKLPREINKSPLATELAVAALLLNSGVSTKLDRLFKGNLPIYSSLEIASTEGIIHFYIRVQRRFRPLIESNFYSQYPGIEIIEADDYTKAIRFHHLSKDVSTWGITFKTAKTWKPVNPVTGKPYSKSGKSEPENDQDVYEMRADFLPLKTYVDYGLDKDPKEEFKIDPLASLIEIMGSIGKGEHMWYQVLVQDESLYNDKKMPKFYVNEKTHKHVSLADMVAQYKKQMRTSHYVKHGDLALTEYGYEQTRKVPYGVDEDGKPKTMEIPLTYNFKEKDRELARAVSKKEVELTQEEKDELEIINKKLSKQLALCVVRLVYVTKKENFNSSQIPSTLSIPRLFKGANALVPMFTTDPYDYPWQNIGQKRSYWRAEEMFESYIEREGYFPHTGKRESLENSEDRFFWASSMKQRKLFRMIYEAIFYPFDHPHPHEVFALNLEEIATLWHLPGATSSSPGLPRIDSNKGVAPSNLPL
jgi:hypothetical protein